MRIAFFSPFNPQKTGVSDYSEELLPYLAVHAEIDLVVNGYPLSNQAIQDRFRVLSPQDFTANPGRYDMAIYQLANNLEQHGYMIPCMKRVPGIAVLHDYYLHYLMLGLTLMNGDMRSLDRILRAKYGSGSTMLAHRILMGMFDPYQISTTVPLVNMSRGVIVHNRFGHRLAAADAGGRPVRVIPMGIPINPVLDASEMKVRHGFHPGDFVLASVSTLSHTKRIHVILKALGTLCPRFPRLQFLILGSGRLGEGARQLIRSLNLESRVHQTGWLTMQSYWRHLNMADAVVDMRYPSGAETSASLLRAMSAAKPVIVSAHGSFLELEDDCCRKIPVGEAEESALCAAIEELIGSPRLKVSMGQASRSHIEKNHRLDSTARSYVEFIREIRDTSWTEPVEDWFSERPTLVVRKAYASVYKASRLVSLVRNYGLSDTMRRIRAARQTSGSGTGLHSGAGR